MKSVLGMVTILLLSSAVTLKAEVTVVNELSALEVQSLETFSPYAVRLTVRNLSPKIITAIDVSTADDTTLTIDSDFSADEVLVNPSTSRTINIDVGGDKPNAQIRILAVVFDDTSGEGVPARLEMIKKTRLGRRDQMRRTAMFWSSLSSAVETDSQQALGQLLGSIISQVSELPETPALEIPPNNRDYAAQQTGLTAAKQEALRDMLQLQQRLVTGSSKDVLQKTIQLFKDQYDKVLAKLEKGAR